MAEQAGKSPRTNHQWPRPLEGPEENLSPSETTGGTSEKSVTDQGNHLQSLPGWITVLWACLAVAVSETGSAISRGLCWRGMPVLPAPSWSCDGQERWRQPRSFTPHPLAEAVSDQAGKHQDGQPKREGCHHPYLSDVFFKAGWKYVPRTSISQTRVPSSMAILTRFDSQKKGVFLKSRDCDAITEFEPQPLTIRVIL